MLAALDLEQVGKFASKVAWRPVPILVLLVARLARLANLSLIWPDG